MFKNNNNILPLIFKEKRNLNLYPFHKIIALGVWGILPGHITATGKKFIGKYWFTR
jgi:hypothetical protein